jgi:hypothetical protein
MTGMMVSRQAREDAATAAAKSSGRYGGGSMNETGEYPLRSVRFGVLIALAAGALLVPSSIAQTPVSETGDGSHPAHIHSGTCAELGDVVVPLADVAYLDGEAAGSSAATPLKLSVNLIDVPLSDILAADHAINIHKSADEIDEYIACADIGGVVTQGERGDDELRFAITELNDSGHLGAVFLGAEGDQTEINIMLVEPDESR